MGFERKYFSYASSVTSTVLTIMVFIMESYSIALIVIAGIIFLAYKNKQYKKGGILPRNKKSLFVC